VIRPGERKLLSNDKGRRGRDLEGGWGQNVQGPVWEIPGVVVLLRRELQEESEMEGESQLERGK
jgi:hypothetical protein